MVYISRLLFKKVLNQMKWNVGRLLLSTANYRKTNQAVFHIHFKMTAGFLTQIKNKSIETLSLKQLVTKFTLIRLVKG